MSVNDIDFTLGSYNPNQAAGLIVMAQENDRKISDSLKGILDGFENTARQNADVQAMNYINSLGLQDMTPDKMVGHTQALEQIANNMGGLNPSKEALTALDGRGNVLTQRENNALNLEAQGITNTSNRLDMQEKGDKHVLDVAINSAIANPSMTDKIKSTLPPHLQALFDEQAYLRKQEYNGKVNKQKTDSAWNTLYAFTPNFTSSDGMVDYDKMFKDKGVITALGDSIYNPEVIGLLLQKMDKEAAEKLKNAHAMALAERKVAIGEGHLALGQAELEQDATKWKAEFDRKVEQDEQKKAENGNNKFQENIKGTPFYGSVSKNADGSLNVDPKQLAANVSNRLSEAARPVEVKYKYPSVDAWWTDNSNFGVSTLEFGGASVKQTGVQDEVKKEFNNFRDSNNKPLSKDTQIAMLEKLRASMDRSTNLGYTSLNDAFGKSAYYKNGKINMNALQAAVINDRIAQANERVKVESFRISRDAANLGIELKILSEYLPTNFASQYSTADPSFMNSIYLADHNPKATAPLNGGGGYTNNALDFFNKIGKNTVLR